MQRSYAAIREPHELVVLQRFARAEPKAAVRSDGAMELSADAMTQLLRDAQCLAKNWHPNIARVEHVDVDGGDVLLGTDLVDGITLGDLLTAGLQRHLHFYVQDMRGRGVG